MVAWYGIGFCAALVLGWTAASLHAAGRAPVGLLSLGVGLTLGMILVAIAAIQRIAGQRRLLVGTILLALITVLAEHAWLYRDFQRQWHQARAESPEVAMFRPQTPWSPAEYFARELTPRRAALWCFDATLITAAAVATVLVLNRKRL